MLSRLGGALAIALTMAGCGGLTELTGGGEGQPSIALASGAVQARGPDHFCVDPRASRPRDGFALFAPCRVLTGEGPGVPGLALVTVQVGAAGTASVAGSEPVFDAFLKSEAGRALLSATGDADAITLRRTRASGGSVTAFFDDTGGPPIAGTQPTEWRGFMDVSDRLVTVSLRGLADAPLSVSVGDALLRQAMVALRNANATESAADS